MIFRIDSKTLYYTGGQYVHISLPVDIRRGITTLVGPNGAGKTTFARILERGRNFRTNRILTESAIDVVRYLEFNDVHNWTGTSVGYYQQRYEAGMNDEVPTVREVMGLKVETEMFQHLATMLRLEGAVEKKINYLSSGELRKLLIINALLDKPGLLVLDNPYIGLDASSRRALNNALLLLKQNGASVMLIVCDEADIPEFTDNTLYAFQHTISSIKPQSISNEEKLLEFEFSQCSSNAMPGDPIVDMTNCTVRYGDITLLDNIDWHIRGGERWSLSGPNGSGKSTLLSLICADNPKSYSNNIALFGRRRGTGESIWDIKKKIGYVSPEMQLHFHGSGTVEHIVANGLNDTVGLYVTPHAPQRELAAKWLNHFGIAHLAQRQFNTLSAGERQLVLVARSFIKEPQLLILDEPMHALDTANRRKVEKTLQDFLEVHPEAALIMVTHNPAELPHNIDHHLKL